MQVCPAEFSSTEIHPFEARTIDVRITNVGFAEVGLLQESFAEVRLDVINFFPPLIPSLDPALSFARCPRIRHSYPL